MPPFDEPATLPAQLLLEAETERPYAELAELPHVELGEVLAEGGAGRVLTAWDGALGRPLAVKQVLPARTKKAGAVEHFLAEARLTASLEHPNIVPVHELGEREGSGPFFTMKLIEGRTLLDHLKSVARHLHGDTLDEIVGVLIDCCDALALAHSRGIVHCDLKSRNVMLGPFGEVYLTDWGSARRVGAPAPVNDKGQVLIVGTPGMLAPEQARGEPLDPRADVFGMGALIYFILARKPPFQGGTPLARAKAAQHGLFEPLSEVAPDTPLALREISARAMALDPDARYPSIQAMKADLDRYRRGRLEVPEESFAPGDVLIRQGDQDSDVYVVVSGRFSVTRLDADGLTELIREVGPGQVLGEAAALSGEARSATVVALERSVVKRVSQERLQDELGRMPSWLRQVVETLAVRFHDRESTGGA